MTRQINKVAVIGGGTMGAGIAQWIAQKGYPVIIKETDEQRAASCSKHVHGILDKIIARNSASSPSAKTAKSLFSTTASYEDLTGIDLVIEAIFENMDVKKAVFKELDGILSEHVLFATNSSSLSITELASATNRPDRFIGAHFFNPVHQMDLVELIKGEKTSDETHESLKRFVRTELGKTPILVDGCPGYLVNRLLLPYLNEAARLLIETRLTTKQIDKRAHDFGWLMGPFELLDFVGIDIAANVAEILYQGYGERAKPVDLMDRMVNLGRFGKKCGAGFYFYNDKTGEDIQAIINREYPDRRELDVEEGFNRMMAGLRNEALLIFQEGTPFDIIETGAVLGIMFPMALEGPLHNIQKKVGFSNLLSYLKILEKEEGIRFKPAAILEKIVAEDGKIFEDKSDEEEW